MNKGNEDSAIIFIAMIIILSVLYLITGLPECVLKMFRNEVFIVVFISLILIFGIETPPYVSLAFAIIFVALFSLYNYQEALENFKTIEKNKYELRGCTKNCPNKSRNNK